MAALIDLELLEEIAGQEECMFRLPGDVENLPKELQGKVMSVERLIRLAKQVFALMGQVPEDCAAAENETAMAANDKLSVSERFHHRQRSYVLRNQARRRRAIALAKVQAVFLAVAVC